MLPPSSIFTTRHSQKTRNADDGEKQEQNRDSATVTGTRHRQLLTTVPCTVYLENTEILLLV